MTILSEKELGAIRFIRNTIIHKGRSPTIRELKDDSGYKSPYSAQLLLKNLEKKGAVKRGGKYSRNIELVDDPENLNTNAKTIDVPIVGNAPCGVPFLAEQNIETTVPVSISLAKPPYHYFLLRAIGDSMNQKGINNGNLVLIRQQSTASNGDVVVALIDDKATIKEFCKTENAVILKPRSTNEDNKPIILNEDFQIQGIVVKALENVYG